MPNVISAAIAAALDCPIDHPLRDFAINLLIDVIRSHRGNVTAAARELGVQPTEIRLWIHLSATHKDSRRGDLARLFYELRVEHPAPLPGPPVAPMHGHNCPWLISDRAADDMLRLRPKLARDEALAELRGYILDIVTRGKQPRALASGCLQYRSGAPLRLRLIVNRDATPPELIEVLPDHNRRARPYERGSKGRPR